MSRSASAAFLAAALLTAAACRTSDDDTKGSDSTATAAASVADSAATGVAPGDVAGSTAAAPAATAGGAFLSPDSASREQLLAVPGMTPALADSLVAHRPYANMIAVDRVLAAGKLSEAQRDTVYTRLWKPLDLNKASGEEITLIPGVGARMRHEFEEYRPYRSIERFRREIGKYVDKAEVARLERYVAIR